MQAEARVPTQRGSHYIKVLLRHFSHRITVEFNETQGVANFPFGHLDIYAEADQLVLKIKAEDAEGFSRIKDVVGGHLEEFAYRGETIKVNWVDVTA